MKGIFHNRASFCIVAGDPDTSQKCIAGNQTWLYRLSQSQKTMYMFSKAYCYLDETWENF
jgi:hypothetical protein